MADADSWRPRLGASHRADPDLTPLEAPGPERRPRLSVVMPVFNGMPFLEDSLRSLLGQSLGDFELVIGDDGSTDGSLELLEQFAARDKRIRLFRRPAPSGLANSANWLVGHAWAPLVAIAHADDLYHRDRLEKQVEALDGDRDMVLVGTLWSGIDEADRAVRPPDYWRLRFWSPFAPFSHSSIMFRRDAFHAAGGYREAAEYWEDLDLYYRMAALGRLATLPFPYSTVRHSAASFMLQAKRASAEAKIDMMFRAAACLRRGEDPRAAARVRTPAPRRVNPLVFVRYGATNVWTGRRPEGLRRMWRRGRLRFDLATLRATAWLAWGTASPRSLRLVMQTALRARSLVARSLLAGPGPVTWRPLSRLSASRAECAEAYCDLKREQLA